MTDQLKPAQKTKLTTEIKNEERPLGEIKWAGPCGNLHTWVGPSFLRTLAISASDERAYAQMPGNKAKWGWPCTHGTGGAGPCKA